MLKSQKLLKTAPWRSIWLCRNLSGSIMKNFVSAITFFKTYIQVTCAKNCKLDEIGVKVSLLPLIVIASPQGAAISFLD